MIPSELVHRATKLRLWRDDNLIVWQWSPLVSGTNGRAGPVWPVPASRSATARTTPWLVRTPAAPTQLYCRDGKHCVFLILILVILTILLKSKLLYFRHFLNNLFYSELEFNTFLFDHLWRREERRPRAERELLLDGRRHQMVIGWCVDIDNLAIWAT